MRKQVLFIAIFAILLTGCNNQQQAQPDDQNMTGKENVVPVVEESNETPVLSTDSDSQDIEETLKTLENERMESKQIQKEQEDAENEQMQKDLELLGSFDGTPTESDCNKITHPDVKTACLDSIEE